MKYTFIPLLILLPATLIAQDDRRPQDTRPQDRAAAANTQKQASLSDVLGMTVRLRASAEARAEAAEDGRIAKKPTGSIYDLLVNTTTGEAQFAVVSVGGILGIGDRSVVVPISTLTWTPTVSNPEFTLDATEAELKALPPFDKKRALADGLNTTVQNANRSWKEVRPDWKKPVDAAAEKADGTERTTEDAGRPIGERSRPVEGERSRTAEEAKRAVDGVAGRVDGVDARSRHTTLLASQLKGATVISSDNQDFGSVGVCSYNASSNTIEYVIVGKGGVLGMGGTDYLVPYLATRPVWSADNNELKLTLKKSHVELANAPEYNKPERGIVSDDNCARACKFFGVDRDAMKMGHKKSDHDTKKTDHDTRKSGGYDPIK